MRLGVRRGAVAIGSGLLLGAIALPFTMWLTMATDRCDTTKHVCDLAPLAGFALWVFLIGPVTTVASALWIYRRALRSSVVGRGDATATAGPDA
jgi:hypothetical protein